MASNRTTFHECVNGILINGVINYLVHIPHWITLSLNQTKITFHSKILHYFSILYTVFCSKLTNWIVKSSFCGEGKEHPILFINGNTNHLARHWAASIKTLWKHALPTATVPNVNGETCVKIICSEEWCSVVFLQQGSNETEPNLAQPNSAPLCTFGFAFGNVHYTQYCERCCLGTLIRIGLLMWHWR